MDTNNNKGKYYANKSSLLSFIYNNPFWSSGFVCGEGCFTAYLSFDIKSQWGLQPGLDFNITQSTNDKPILEAINFYFKNQGGVYDKPNNVSVVAFRNVKTLKETIVPFFDKYPLIGMKSYEYEKWKKLVDIYYSKTHVGKNISTKNSILLFAEITMELNRNRFNFKKLNRLETIIHWLNSLHGFPSMEDKFILFNDINKNKK